MKTPFWNLYFIVYMLLVQSSYTFLQRLENIYLQLHFKPEMKCLLRLIKWIANFIKIITENFILTGLSELFFFTISKWLSKMTKAFQYFVDEKPLEVKLPFSDVSGLL